MTESVKVFPTVHLTFVAFDGEGMQLEICPADLAGHVASADALACIPADDQEKLWFELFDATGNVARIPLAELERAIAAATPEVYGEAWYAGDNR
jgi:hypothetical protein